MALNDKVRVTWDDLKLGYTVPWSIYSESGKLLLGAGQTIAHQQVLDGLRKYVLFRYESDGDLAHSKKHMPSMCLPGWIIWSCG